MKDKSSNIAAWVFVSPYVITLILFFAFAAVRVIYYSFTDYNLFDSPSFVGIQNFVNLFNDANFKFALRNTLVYAVIVTTIQSILALILAAILNVKIRGIHIFRAGFYLPSVTSSVVITVIFLWLFQRKGLINYVLSSLKAYLPVFLVFLGIVAIVQLILYVREKRMGLPVRPLELSLIIISVLVAGVIVFVLRFVGAISPAEVDPVDIIWLKTRDAFMGIPIPLWAIMIQNIFTTIPTLMLLFLAGLQDVPPQLYEAAKIDGANAREQFFNITLPSLRPVIFLVVTLSLIGTLQMFDQVAIYGDAVPLESVITLAYYVYNRMFPSGALPDIGAASAAAIFLATITIIAIILQRKIIGNND